MSTEILSPPSTGLSFTAVEEAMHPGVLTCPPETPLRYVARMMARYNVHAVVVFTDDAELADAPTVCGVVSDADLMVAAAADDVDGRTAGGTARSPVVTVTPGETLARAAQLMTEHGATHLVVVSHAGERPLGIVSSLDVARAIAAAH